MSFLSKSKDWGIGTRGPFGRMQSGGERLGNMLQEWANEERMSGVNKAVASASKSGQITPEMMIQISEQWKVPLTTVMATAKPINVEMENTRLKNLGQSLYLRFNGYAQENPGKTPLQPELLKMIKESGGTENDLAFSMGVLQQIVKAKDIEQFTLGPNQKRFKSIDGKVTTVAENIVPEKAETDKSKIWLHNNETEVEVLNAEKSGYLKKGWKVGKFPGGSGSEGKLTQKDMAADIRAAAQKLTGIEAGENIVKEIMATPANTAARKELKRQLLVMIKEYEERFGVAAARAVGFDTTLSKPEKQKVIVRSGFQNGKKVVEYDDGSIEYAD